MLWLFATLLMFGIAWAWRTGMKPAPNVIESEAHLKQALEFLQRRGLDGATVRFQVANGELDVVTIAKTIHGPGRTTLSGRCEQRGATAAEFAHFRKELSAAKVTSESLNSGEHTVEIDFGPDTDLAARFVTTAFEQLFHLPLGPRCIAYFDRVLLRDHASLTGQAERNE